jgi:hypothetical protein
MVTTALQHSGGREFTIRLRASPAARRIIVEVRDDSAALPKSSAGAHDHPYPPGGRGPSAERRQAGATAHGWLAPDRRIMLLTVFRKTRMREDAEVDRAKQARKLCEAERHTAHDEFTRDLLKGESS